MAGLIRLQWWRDALAAIAADRPPRPSGRRSPADRARRAPDCRARLEAAIDARERELEDPPPADLAALERQLEGSSAAIIQAALVILGASDAAALEVGRRIGLVVGLADRLRSLEADLRQGRMLLPTPSWRATASIRSAPTVAGQKLAPVVATIAGRGLDQLRAARAARRAVPAAGARSPAARHPRRPIWAPAPDPLGGRARTAPRSPRSGCSGATPSAGSERTSGRGRRRGHRLAIAAARLSWP